MEERRATRGSITLVVDDDPAIRSLITAALRRQQIRVECCTDGSDAIRLLESKEYRALVLDLMMPHVSGWAVIDWLAENQHRRPRTVIVITAADRKVIHELNPEIVNAVIFKPFDVFDLASYVKACVSHELPIDRRKRRIVR